MPVKIHKKPVPDLAGEECSTFLNAFLNLTKEPLEFRALAVDDNIVDRLWSRSHVEIQKFAEKHNGVNHVLFSPATRINGKGKKPDCREAALLWVDIDFKDFANGENEARALLASYPLSPSAVISSGGGLHSYWRLEEPVQLTAEARAFEAVLRGLVKALNGDAARAEIASVMRLPGTMNMKPERTGAICKVEGLHLDREYPFDAFSKEEKTSFAHETAIQNLGGEIVQGNRDQGAFNYINAVIKQRGASTDDKALEETIRDLLSNAGGEGLEGILAKVPGWIATAHQMFDESRKPTPLVLAEGVLASHGGYVVYVDRQFRTYRDGHWPLADEQYQFRKRIAQIDRPYTTATRTNNALQILKDLTAIEEFSPRRDLICLTNGTLDPQTGELIEHSPGHQIHNQLPIAWQPSAKCKGWLNFLAAVFSGDPDAAEKIQFLQMFFGYCLVPDTRQHKFLWMIGVGANGKSVTLRVLTELVGQENVSHAMITRFGSAFVRGSLQDKLVNVSSEMRAEDTISEGYLKAITAGDRVEAEKKYGPSFSFAPYVRIVAATNELPRSLDLSQGFRRRAVILPFNRSFSEKEQDKNLVEKLLGELPGILVWAIEGLHKLRAAGSFPIPPSSHASVDEYMKESDPARQFVEETLIEDLHGAFTTKNLYERYVEWATDRGFRRMNIISFGKRLTGLSLKTRLTNGKKMWCVKSVNTYNFG